MNDWKEFEKAVTSFLAAIGPGAKVYHDVRIPDKDTGTMRQRDVWVEVRMFGLFDVKVLVSCKMLKRPVNSQDMDAFIGELLSAGAQKGILYSQSGFTKPALKKAAVHNISCCKLYRNEPADIPEQLLITCYCCMPRIQLAMQWTNMPEVLKKTFAELFDTKINGASANGTALDALVAEYERAEGQAMDEARRERRLPKAFETGIRLEREEGEGEPAALQIAMRIYWRVYKSRIEAQPIEGTYAFGEKRFVGTQHSPVIDMKGIEPGPGWELMTETDKEVVSPYAMFILRGDARETLERVFGDKRVEDIFKS